MLVRGGRRNSHWRLQPQTFISHGDGLESEVKVSSWLLLPGSQTAVPSLRPHMVVPLLSPWVLISSSYKGPSHTGLGPTHRASFSLNYTR